MGEDFSSGLLEGSPTTSGVPIEHLDYGYIEKCSKSKELEKILRVLRSGEEGHYPELIKFTEERLQKVNPKSKSLRKELPINTYRDLTKSEHQEITDDLQDWMANINEEDEALKKLGGTKGMENDNLPPIRTAVRSEKPPAEQPQKPTAEKKKPVTPRSYHEWDRFDPDKEIESLEKQEEKEKKKKQEKVRATNKNAISANVDLTGKSDTERKILATREKEKGNEAFQSGHYSEALTFYCRSIELDPKAAAVYNNRALAEIKLGKFQEAVDDCDHVLSIEPKNVKAYLRRSIAHRGKGLNEEARKDLNQVLSIEPKNKRALELLDELKKKENSKSEEHSKLGGKSAESHRDKSELNGSERTSSNNHSSVKTEKVSSMKPKGKRMKIIEVASENEPETSAKSNEERNINKTSTKSFTHSADKAEANQRTMDGEGVQSSDKEEVKKQPQLPGLVQKAQEDATRLFKLGRFAEAAEQFTQAIDILKQSKEEKVVSRHAMCALLCNRGSCMIKIGDCTSCINDCTSALEVSPGAFRPLLKRAEAYEILEKFDKAWLDYQMALKISPSKQHCITWKLQSSVALPTTDSSSAHPTPTQSAEEATDQLHPSPPQGITESMPTTTHPTVEAPVDPAVRFAQCKEEGNSLVKQVDNVLLLLLLFLCQSVFICFLMLQKRSAAFAFNRCEEAVARYTECINIDPINVAIYTNRALCYLRLNQHELAMDDATEALRLQPDNVKALFRRALGKKALGQYDSAARDLLSLQKIEPKNAAAKKELKIVLEMCRKERRSSHDKNAKLKERKEEKKAEQQAPKISHEETKISHEETKTKWKRVTIRDVQDRDHEEDEGPVPSPKQPSPSTANKLSDKAPINPMEGTTTGRPVKLAKKTPYDFFQAWNSVKKNDTKDYADLLRQLETKRLTKVLSNKLDAPMLSSIIAALSQEIVPQGEEKLACHILEELSHVERFDMVLLFMSSKEKKELQQLFSNLQVARDQKKFVTSDEFEQLQKKYWN
ncbi:unnamed protein product [Pocillopora meandrina]|uniref:RNA-polymerase II-associated protein 3-like C-terminal domain-containing protein n=1 Tax=Pocillopora meandrina TaxID=46732 RepID=A0AAU9XYZ6_9CNID|nr:unnamed protein product [Pocillopora meandrina]